MLGPDNDDDDEPCAPCSEVVAAIGASGNCGPLLAIELFLRTFFEMRLSSMRTTTRPVSIGWLLWWKWWKWL